MSEPAVLESPALRNQRKEAEAVAGAKDGATNEIGAVSDDRERFHALLDFYEQGLHDLRMFVHKKSFINHMDDEEFYSRLEAKIASPTFLETLGSIHMASTKTSLESQDDKNSWHFINEKDWISSEFDDPCNSLKLESYVVVTQDDIIDGMACFMAKYVSSLPQLKDLSPRQLQMALKKVLGPPQKGRFRRLWNGSKYLYTAASWGATAVSLYNNPTLTQAASKAFWASIQLVTKLV